MIQCINHTALSTPDLERAICFYRDQLGFEVLSRFEIEPGHPGQDEIMQAEGVSYEAAMLRLGASMIEIFEFHEPRPQPRQGERPVSAHGITHLCLQVDDVKAEYQRLSAAGMRFHAEPVFQFDTGFAYGRDPDGNVLELIEFEDPESPFDLWTG
jgi:catechol 2,3-dioxygenase-like lactoylglutathione lyase family enzyme